MLVFQALNAIVVHAGKVEMLSAEPLAVVQLTGCVLAPADNLSIATS